MKKRKKILILLLMSCLMMPMFIYPSIGAEEKREHHVQLATGAVYTWTDSTGKWQNKNIIPGQSYEGTADVGLEGVSNTNMVENVIVKVYDSDFSWGTENFFKYPMPFGQDETQYMLEYVRYMPFDLSISQAAIYDSKTGSVSFGYKGTLIGRGAHNSNDPEFDVKEKLRTRKGQDEMYVRIAGSKEAADDDTRAFIEGIPKGGQSSKVQGYVYFLPFLIEYDIVERPMKLLPIKVLLDCGKDFIYIGEDYPLKGVVENRNGAPVVTHYVLSVNEKTLKDVWALQASKKALQVRHTYPVPSTMEPGTLLNFKLKATQYWALEPPPSEIWDGGTGTNVHNPGYDEFIGSHKAIQLNGKTYYYDPTDSVSGESTCKKGTRLPEEDPIENGLTPSIIVD